ncbi:hypothetical protein J437_LFUL018382 [Ladona fulva]|uniref:Uncharacterized protein n=1 Tax=Ladona fulva TaxID=123851 RepID=A0A8K0PBB1_LADFU|nr:hypothetical protein J437_LFUL018382 [Ladona fulva]
MEKCNYPRDEIAIKLEETVYKIFEPKKISKVWDLFSMVVHSDTMEGVGWAQCKNCLQLYRHVAGAST